MNNMPFKLLTLFLLTTSIIFASNINIATNAKITQLSSYTQLEEDSITFISNKQNGLCKGYWVSPTMLGFDTTISILMTAYQSQSEEIVIYASNAIEDKWSGNSTEHFCKVTSLFFDAGVSITIQPETIHIIANDNNDYSLTGNASNNIIKGN
jgi:hypothetical protein